MTAAGGAGESWDIPQDKRPSSELLEGFLWTLFLQIAFDQIPPKEEKEGYCTMAKNKNLTAAKKAKNPNYSDLSAGPAIFVGGVLKNTYFL